MKRISVLIPVTGLMVLACRVDSGDRAPSGESAQATGATAAAETAGGVAASRSESRSSCAPSIVAGPDSTPTYSAVRVNVATVGMASRTFWALSPDRCVLVVSDDPAAVEAEPVPNGVLVVSERSGRVSRLDSVWSAEPSPDWTRIAFGRGYVVHAGEKDSLPLAKWEALARATGIPLSDVRAASFPASGMAYAVGLAQAGVLDIETGVRRIFPVASGWQVRWSADGSQIAAGGKPRRSNDDEESERWIAIDARDGTPRGEVPSVARFATTPWREGPMIDISLPLDSVLGDSSMRAVRERPLVGVVGRDTVTVRTVGRNVVLSPRCGASACPAALDRVVGPGIALATTASARFILALRQREPVRSYDPPTELVVYQRTRDMRP